VEGAGIPSTDFMEESQFLRQSRPILNLKRNKGLQFTYIINGGQFFFLRTMSTDYKIELCVFFSL